LSTATYVGKDVSITIQIPVDREEKTIPSSSPYKVTLNNGPISDRDQDGVANEVAHVSVVDESGNAIMPTAVNDATKEVTFGVGDAGKIVYITYRYDLSPYNAQELTVEPKQAIEGIDALGSDTVQLWTCLLKEFLGSIKEILKNSLEQLNRIEALRTMTVESFGIIVTWSSGGSTVKVGLNQVRFPEGSIPSPKNAPVFIVTPFRAMTAKTIS
jgi:uncharacterized protein YnzC (UPF0291/DUF896 family)